MTTKHGGANKNEYLGAAPYFSSQNAVCACAEVGW